MLKDKNQERLNKIRTFMLDLDGTFYLGEKLFPWSQDFVQALRKQRKEFIFVTNNSSRNARYYVAKITRMGVPVERKHVFTSGDATIYWLKKQGIGPKIWVSGTPDLEAEFVEAGFKLTCHQPAAVVLGFDQTLTYEKLRLFCDLVRKGVPFIATHPDYNCPTPNGPIPDCGAMIAAVTAATGLKPKIIGKPYPEMVEALCDKYDLHLETVAIVGDRLYTDIAMGRATGILSILVLSGETRPEDLAGAAHQPDLIAKNLGEIARWLL